MTRVRRRWRIWWRRPAGGREVLRLALPLVVSTASWTVMNFIDRMFLLWDSTTSMAAAMPAGVLYFAVICFPLGTASYVNTFVAQYEGAGRPERIGRAVWQGVWIAAAFIPVFLATIPLAPLVFRGAGHQPELADLEITYYQILTAGAGGTLIAGALAAFFTGRGDNRAVMWVSCSSALVNIALDYAWIFGRCGFPAWGIAGAAWATVVAQWYTVAAYALLMWQPVYRRRYHLAAGCRLDRALLGRLLRFGGPNGLTMLVEVLAFTLFILLVGQLGQDAMAATTLAFNVNNVAFVPLLGLGIAVSTLVGRELGRDQPDLAARATWTSFRMAMAYTGFFALLYVAVPNVFLCGHAAGTDPRAFAELRDLTVVLLRFVAAYCLFDAMNVVFVSAIKGAGDTRFVLAMNVVLVPLPVLAAWLGIRYLDLGLLWCWSVVTAWVVAWGLIYLARFVHGHWRSLRVIEPDLPVENGPPTAVWRSDPLVGEPGDA